MFKIKARKARVRNFLPEDVPRLELLTNATYRVEYRDFKDRISATVTMEESDYKSFKKRTSYYEYNNGYWKFIKEENVQNT